MQKKSSLLRNHGLAAIVIALVSVILASCTTTMPDRGASASSRRDEINGGADATLSKLYRTAPASRELVARAKGVLILPTVLQASFVVEAEYGKGVLRVGNRTEGHYSTTTGSIGF